MKKTISLLLAVLLVLSSFFCISFNALAEDEKENEDDNNVKVSDIFLDKNYTASFDKDDEYDKDLKMYNDTFLFEVPVSGNLTLSVKSKKKGYLSEYCTYCFINEDGKTWITTGNKLKKNYTIKNIPKGNYYFFVLYKKTKEKAGAMLGGTYDFKLKYAPNVKVPTLSKLGAKKKAFTASWKKTKGVNGYELSYSTNKNFKKAKSVKIDDAKTLKTTVSKLKGKKKYYVRIRAYKKIDLRYKTKTYYSKWSKSKVVKTK